MKIIAHSKTSILLCRLTGVVFAFEASVLNLGTLISPVILNNIYSATVQTQPNFVFIFIGVCSVIPVMLTG